MQININGKTIEYQILKPANPVESTPLFIVHGWGGSSQSLLPLAQLCAENYTTVILDLPGFGNSDLPDSDWGVYEYTEVLAQFISKLGYDSINYFGHSFGGAIGVVLAHKYPQLIKHLILCAPSYKRNPKINAETELKGIKKIIKDKLPIIRRVYYKLLYPNSDIFIAPQLESNFKKIVTQDLSPLLPEIRTETLVIAAALDKAVSIESMNYLHQTVQNSQIKVYENSGHSLPKVHPTEIYQDIDNFIKESDAK